jgi:hypothetical protein
VPEDRDDPVAAFGCIDEPAGDLPGPTGVKAHVAVERAVHDRERDLQDIYSAARLEIERPEGMAHTVPEPGAVGIPEGGVVSEPRAAQVLPGLRDPEPEEVVPVADDRPAEDCLQPLLLGREGRRVAVGPVTTVKTDLPASVGDRPDLPLEIPHVVGVVLVPGSEGEEVETRPSTVLLFKSHDLREVAEREFLRPDLLCACESLCEVSTLQGGEGRNPLGEDGSVDHIDIVGEADGERLVVRVLGAVALLAEVPGSPGLKGLPVVAHVMGEPVVTVPEYLFVLLRAGEEAPGLRVLLEDVVHLHGCLKMVVGSIGRTLGTLQRTIHTPLPHPVIPPQHPRHVHNDRLPVADLKHLIERQPRKHPVRRIHNDTIHRPIEPLERRDRLRPEPLDLRGSEERVVAVDIDIELLEFVNHLPGRALPGVRDVLFVGQAQDEDFRVADHLAGPVQFLDRDIGDVLGHRVVDRPAGQDHLRVVAELLGLVDQVVGVDRDAVAADEAGAVVVEVPLRPGGLEDRLRLDTHLPEDDRELVHEGDVDVPLDVLDHLRRLGGPDVPGDVDVGHEAVERGEALRGLLVHAGDDLRDLLEDVLGVARVDPLGRVADGEALPADPAGDPLEGRDHDLLGEAGVDGRLEDDNGAVSEVPADGLGGRDDIGDVGVLGLRHRGGDGDDHDVGLADPGGVRGGDDVVARFGVDPGDLLRIEVVADRPEVPRECIGKGVPDVSEADDADCCIFE